MHLKERSGHQVCHFALDGVEQGCGRIFLPCHTDDFIGAQYVANAQGYCRFGGIIVLERIGDAGARFMTEQHQAARTIACRAGLVKGQRAVRRQVTEHQVKTSGIDDVTLIGLAMAVDVINGIGTDDGMDVAPFNVNLGIQALVD